MVWCRVEVVGVRWALSIVLRELLDFCTSVFFVFREIMCLTFVIISQVEK